VPGNADVAKEGRDMGEILSLTRTQSLHSPFGARRRTNMKLKKLKKKIQQLEKRLREGPGKLASLKRKLQQAESAKALKAARKSAVRATASGGTRKPKRKLNLSPERRAQLSATMKARWEAKRAADGNSSTPTNQKSPLPPMQAPENRSDGA
jgi:predicted RNase H-like nuclease (RuvC/YqgF family)